MNRLAKLRHEHDPGRIRAVMFIMLFAVTSTEIGALKESEWNHLRDLESKCQNMSR